MGQSAKQTQARVAQTENLCSTDEYPTPFQILKRLHQQGQVVIANANANWASSGGGHSPSMLEDSMSVVSRSVQYSRRSA